MRHALLCIVLCTVARLLCGLPLAGCCVFFAGASVLLTNIHTKGCGQKVFWAGGPGRFGGVFRAVLVRLPACLPGGKASSDVCMASDDSICFFPAFSVLLCITERAAAGACVLGL